jgi:hypothetical protein
MLDFSIKFGNIIYKQNILRISIVILEKESPTRRNIMSKRRFSIFLIIFVLVSALSLSPEMASANPQTPIGGYTKYFLEKPAYDSGWVSIAIRPDPVVIPFDHNLNGNPNEYFVQLDCRDSSELGHFDCTNNLFHKTAHWFGLTDSQVKVWVTGGTVPSLIRVRIWRLNPFYTSGWVSTGSHPDPISIPFTHNLNTSVYSTMIALDCWDNTELGYYDCTDHFFNTGAHWYSATNSSIIVYIDGGILPDSVRVRIYKIMPKYDSGWIPIGIRPDPIVVPFNHPIGCPVYNMKHQIMCSARSVGIYDCTNNNFVIDAHWYALSDYTIDAFVNNGSTPSSIRILFYFEELIFLPVVISN